ncbi:MAG: hypothetical protein ACFFAX_14505, partial [Promethearchaeota archaeon]
VGFFEGWLSSTFGVNDYIGDGSNSETLVGSVGGPYADVSYTYGGGDGSRAGGGADWVRTMEFSMGMIEYQSSGYDEYAATSSPFANGVFFGFAFDAISNSSGRLDLMNRTLSYFNVYDSPSVNIVAPISGSLERAQVDLEWSSYSPIPGAFYNPSYNIFIDGQEYVSEVSSETYSVALENGNHTVRIVCEDNYGQRGYANVSIECDAIYPQIEALNHAPGSVLQSNTLIVFEIIEDHFDTALARWSTGSWVTFMPPFETVLPSGNGNHAFYIIAFDLAGNMNSTEFTFTCDDVFPDIALVDMVNGSVLSSNAPISFEINDTHFDKAEYHWDLDDSTEFVFPFEVSMPTGDGIHDLYVSATDVAGNQRVNHYQFITDDVAPSFSLMNMANGTILRSGSPMSLRVSDLHFESASYRWDLADSGSFDTSEVVLYAPPLEGENWLFVNATDTAGNRATTSFLFIVDNTAPEVTLTSPLDGSTIPMNTEIAIEVTDLYLESVFLKWDSGDWIECNFPYIAYSPAGEGNHALFVIATDYAGNSRMNVFVFITEEMSTTSATTTSTATTPSPTSPAEPRLDLPASLGIMGIGVYLGLIIGIFVWPRLRGRRPSVG